MEKIRRSWKLRATDQQNKMELLQHPGAANSVHRVYLAAPLRTSEQAAIPGHSTRYVQAQILAPSSLALRAPPPPAALLLLASNKNPVLPHAFGSTHGLITHHRLRWQRHAHLLGGAVVAEAKELGMTRCDGQCDPELSSSSPTSQAMGREARSRCRTEASRSVPHLWRLASALGSLESMRQPSAHGSQRAEETRALQPARARRLAGLSRRRMDDWATTDPAWMPSAARHGEAQPCR
ncbi:hypothetical protein CDD83_7600 [Cordyceps sp. RAO-2017]|nr:hypothetical protein CDD83_7600 [Cordyceps sp. RAO-2017]